jgi:hypothetical protein
MTQSSSLQFHCELLFRSRKFLADSLQTLPEEYWHRIPEGFSSHIAWNLGHITVTQYLLVYARCSAPCRFPESWIEKFRKGTLPQDGVVTVPPQEILSLFLDLPSQIKKDAESGLLDHYEPFVTGIGVQLDSALNALTFDAWHEGWHSGLIRGLIRSFQLRA